jgi:hypothetical protein
MTLTPRATSLRRPRVNEIHLPSRDVWSWDSKGNRRRGFPKLGRRNTGESATSSESMPFILHYSVQSNTASGIQSQSAVCSCLQRRVNYEARNFSMVHTWGTCKSETYWLINGPIQKPDLKEINLKEINLCEWRWRCRMKLLIYIFENAYNVYDNVTTSDVINGFVENA